MFTSDEIEKASKARAAEILGNRNPDALIAAQSGVLMSWLESALSHDPMKIKILEEQIAEALEK